MQPMEQQEEKKIIGNQDADLIRSIYKLTHDVSVNNSPELRLRLTELTKEAEKRGLL